MDRDLGPKTQYGPTYLNFAVIEELKQVYRKYDRANHDPAHSHAIDMVLTKLGRICTGDYVEDNYVDASAYIDIANKIARAKHVSAPGQS